MYDFYLKNLMLSSIMIAILLLCWKPFHRYLSGKLGYTLCKLLIMELLPVWIPVYVTRLSPSIMVCKHTAKIFLFLPTAGFVIMTCIGVVSYCQTLYTIKKFQDQSDEKITTEGISLLISSRMKRKKNITIISSKGIGTPFSFGIWHHYIVIPCYIAENKSSLTCVLHHELTHIVSHDCLWKMLSYVLCCLYWFHPLVWLLYCYMDRECELSCDEKTLQYLGDSFKKDYLKTILLCCTKGQKYSHVSLAQPFGSSGKLLKERMDFIMKKQKKKLGISILMLVLLSGICFLGHLQFKVKATVNNKDNERVTQSVSSDKNIESDTISYEKQDSDDTSTVTVIKKQAAD